MVKLKTEETDTQKCQWLQYYMRPIVSWDFAGAVSIFGPDAPSCRPPMTFTGIRTRDLSGESRSS